MEKQSWKAVSDFSEASCKSVKPVTQLNHWISLSVRNQPHPADYFHHVRLPENEVFLKEFADKTTESKNQIILKDSKLFLKLKTGHIPWVL